MNVIKNSIRFGLVAGTTMVAYDTMIFPLLQPQILNVPDFGPVGLRSKLTALTPPTTTTGSFIRGFATGMLSSIVGTETGITNTTRGPLRILNSLPI